MSLQFKPLSIENVQHLRDYIPSDVPVSCNYGYVCVYGWSGVFSTEIAFSGGMAYLKFRYMDQTSFLAPIGNSNMDVAMAQLEQYCIDNDCQPALIGVSNQQQKLIENVRPDRYRFTVDRNLMDYIYLRQSLAEFPGKRLQPKRNHVNKFRKLYPSYRFEPLTPTIAEQCIQFESCWIKANTAKEDETIKAERDMINRLLPRFSELGIIGGALFVEDRMVAFSFGSAINNVTFDVCVEKADTSFEGSYAMVCSEMAAHLPSEFIFVNREEDMGLEGLRHSKLSYQPFEILEKKNAFPVEMNVYDWEVRRLYNICFDDNTDYCRFYFKERYTRQNTYSHLVEGHVVAALQVFEYPLWIWGTELNCCYLSGACTALEFRKQGIMSQLINQTHVDQYLKGVIFSILIPANESLQSYYCRLGYVMSLSRQQTSRIIPSVEQTSDELQIYRVNVFDGEVCDFVNKSLKDGGAAVLHSAQDFQVLTDYYTIDGRLLLVARRNQSIDGVLIGESSGLGRNVLKVDYLAGNEHTMYELLVHAGRLSGTTEAEIRQCGCNAPTVAMARIINAQAALASYAAAFPTEQVVLNISDPCIAANNGRFMLSAGTVQQLSGVVGNFSGSVVDPTNSDEISVEELTFDAAQLTSWLFRHCSPFICLMLDE